MVSTDEMASFNSRLNVYKERFDASFPIIVNELVRKGEEDSELHSAATWLRECINYNAFDGKKTRGLMVIGSVDFLTNGKLSEVDMQKAICLGWCVELLQAVFLVADDIMDRSELRRGKPCWYKKVGLVAINDTYLMEQCIYTLIDKYFSNESYCSDLYKSFHKITFLTAMGQELDMIASQMEDGKVCFNNFTEEKYLSIVKYKTAYYSFYLPVSLGMILAGINDPKIFEEAEKVLKNLGQFFQIQDDYLDCYGDPKVMGKVGRDIEDAKCTWLVVQALKLASSEEREILEQNYGKEDKASVQRVKDLYAKLNLKEVFLKFESESYSELLQLVNEPKNGFPRNLFVILANQIFKRKK